MNREIADHGPLFGATGSALSRAAIILFTSGIGALWLHARGPIGVIRIASPLEEMVPFWYMLTAFPVLGMLLADLADLYRSDGLGRKSIELAAQIGFLILISGLRLKLMLPLSGHALLFAFFILRRILVKSVKNRFASLELAVVIILFLIIVYVKLFWWADPITLSVGILIALGQVALSRYILKAAMQP